MEKTYNEQVKVLDTVDRALARMWLVGYDNLTGQEKKILNSADRRGGGGKN